MPWESGYVVANGLRLHYTRSGRDTGKPPLVLAHGISDDGPCWTPIAAAMEDDFDVIMADARGHGRSDAPDGDYSHATPLDWPHLLGQITCPALLITADPALGAIATPADAAHLKSVIPHLHLAHIPGAGHSIRREQPAAYLTAVRAFLADF